MSKIILIILLVLIVNSNYGQEFDFKPKYDLSIENIEIIDLGAFYSSLVFKPVFVDSRLRGKTIRNTGYMPNLTRLQMVEILNTYFIMNGIEIKNYKDYVIFVLKE